MHKFDEEDVRTALRQVVDPELGINVVDLGLVYSVQVEPEAVSVHLTMTSRACPLAPMMVDEAERVLEQQLPGLQAAHVELVWDPPWDPSRMSDAAREELGWS